MKNEIKESSEAISILVNNLESDINTMYITDSQGTVNIPLDNNAKQLLKAYYTNKVRQAYNG